MAGIKDYSTTASDNNSAAPNGFPEGMAPSGLNDTGRQVMADIRAWYEDAEWRDFGDSPTYASGTSFTVSGDLTARYVANRRVRAVGSSTGTIYGTISSSSYSDPNTTVNVTWDSGSLVSETLAVSLGMLANNIGGGGGLPISSGGTGATSRGAAQEALGIYHGRVSRTGTLNTATSGWSAQKIGTVSGVAYEVTHSLGTDEYRVVITNEIINSLDPSVEPPKAARVEINGNKFIVQLFVLNDPLSDVEGSFCYTLILE